MWLHFCKQKNEYKKNVLIKKNMQERVRTYTLKERAKNKQEKEKPEKRKREKMRA